MSNYLVKYCSKCGYRINPEEDRFCPCCGKKIIRQEEEAPLSEEDVKDIPIIEKSPIEEIKGKKDKPKIKEPWLTGSYYIGVIALVITLFLIAGKIVKIILLPFVIIIILIGISLFGSFQMRFDKTYKELSLFKLIFLSFKKFIYFFCEADKTNKPDKPKTD